MEAGNNVWWERAVSTLCGKAIELEFTRVIWAARRDDLFIDTLLSVRKYYVTSNDKLIYYLPS